MNTLLRLLVDLLLRFLRTLDLPLLVALLAIMGIGLATLYSASNESMRLVATQGVFFCVGLGALWVASRIPAHVLKQATPAIFALS
ncbi:MAG: rod shape-determining protein RodA, partial [Comamonadaceae bacterium]